MTEEETKNWKFHHLGVIVGDMEKAAEYYRSLGFIEFLPERPSPANPPTWVEMTAYGKTVLKDGKLMVPPTPEAKSVPNTWCRIGPITLELIQPDGINHIAYTVDGENFEQEIEKMKAKGLDIILSGRQSTGGGYVYFDTRKEGGIITELMSYPGMT